MTRDVVEKIPFEEALDRTGYGPYNYFQTATTGLAIVAYALVGFSGTMVVPTSACELGTTPAQQGILAAIPFIGYILGGVVWGYLGDTRGRRRMLLVSLSLAIFFNTLVSLSINWIMMLVLQFLTTIVSTGQYTLAVTLLSESAPMAKRNLVMLLVASTYILSTAAMSGIAIPIIPLKFSYSIPFLGIFWNSWRTLVLVYSAPCVLCLLCVLCLHESPKFLLLKGEEEKAMKILRSIHRINHRNSEEKFQVTGVLPEQNNTTKLEKSRMDIILPLIKTPLLKYTIGLTVLSLCNQISPFIIWFPKIANQFVNIIQNGDGSNQNLCGIIENKDTVLSNIDAAPCSLNVPSLLITIGLSFLTSAGNLILCLVVNYTGRRNLVIFLTLALGVCGVATNLVHNAYGSGVLFLIFCFGLVINGLYLAMAVAFFPTSVRATAVAFVGTLGGVAKFAGTQILNLLLQNHCEAGFYIFGSLFAFSAIVALFLPDDRMVVKAAPRKKSFDCEKTP
ncbi:unnamed protein product [Plutella xylostella]|uniref:(diamondback moth) hypothetical protein n=1 Tax=Plutella xylostella TaxID=51655 RepID=A0A8S4G634_PLUXY|nr:unnamed protein product [Plutella xylostella]